MISRMSPGRAVPSQTPAATAMRRSLQSFTPTEGALWLGEHGLDFGLCRTYANEVWHFEPLPKGATTCAPMLPDSSSGW